MAYLKCYVASELWYRKAKLLHILGFRNDLRESRVKVNQVFQLSVVTCNKCNTNIYLKISGSTRQDVSYCILRRDASKIRKIFILS